MWHGYEDCRNLAVHNVYIGAEVFLRELSWVREDQKLGPALWPAAEEQPGRHLTAAAQDRLSGWVCSLRDAGPERGLAWWLAHLLLVLNEIADADGVAAPAERGGTHQAVLLAARLLEDEPARPWTLAELAGAVNLAPSYLVRLFARQVGLPPLAYLARLRAERAAGLLIETDLSIAAIGDRVGWPDPNYMSRRFRACFGQSPSEYRRLLTSSGPPGRGARHAE
jgi:AraC family L-rhamnose operon transcriptional activator RhaR